MKKAFGLLSLGFIAAACQSIPTNPTPPNASYAGAWFNEPVSQITFNSDGTLCSLEEGNNHTSGHVLLSADTLLSMKFADSITTINLWTRGDSLVGDEIHGDEFRWVSFHR